MGSSAASAAVSPALPIAAAVAEHASEPRSASAVLLQQALVDLHHNARSCEVQ
jgi:hypothetical protein